jgi:ribosome-binding protein aMBF1 (putative translation factor)
MTARRCEICGEPIRTDRHGYEIDAAEMYSPAGDSTIGVGRSVICHAECGLARGFEVA